MFYLKKLVNENKIDVNKIGGLIAPLHNEHRTISHSNASF
jgi:hypothetical protein